MRRSLLALALVSACERAPTDAPAQAPAAEERAVVEPGVLAPSGPPRGTDPFTARGIAALTEAPRMGWPVQTVHITSEFGWRVDPVSGQGTRLHRGVDFRGAIGDPVLAVAAGQVVFAGHDELLGNHVIVDHGQRVQSFYGHLSDVLVHAGVDVDRGAMIGLVGNTGRSAAPHLHRTIKLDDVAVDPLALIGVAVFAPTALAQELPQAAPAAPP